MLAAEGLPVRLLRHLRYYVLAQTLQFCLQDVLFTGMGPQHSLPPPDRQDTDAKYLAFVSGLGVGDESADPQRLALVVDYLTGMLGDSREHHRLSRVGAPEGGKIHEMIATFLSDCPLCWLQLASST